jgi:hypothetical protein
MPGMKSLFHSFAHRVAEAVGSPWAFFIGLLVIIIRAITGPAFGYSDMWQLVNKTGTTVITFLMVFLIQHTQNRDSQAYISSSMNSFVLLALLAVGSSIWKNATTCPFTGLWR